MNLQMFSSNYGSKRLPHVTRRIFSTQICFLVDLCARAYARGGVGVKNPPFSLIFYEKFITCAKEIDCFRILFAC